jgi:hypothetical protein
VLLGLRAIRRARGQVVVRSPLCHRTPIPKSVRSTVRTYVFEKTFGRVHDARAHEQ